MDTVFCDYCQKGLSGLVIRCVECADFDLCSECFSCGVECGTHKREHKYRVENVLNSLVFETPRWPWNQTEEHKLLDAVEEYGFGNWTEVAGHVKTRASEECEEHFSTYYVNGNIGKATFPTVLGGQITDLSSHLEGPVKATDVHPVPPLDLSLQEQQELGFMILRDDFEREYNNSAEDLISGLTINADDDELDAEMKVCSVSKYRIQLHERARRKRIAHNHCLITTSLIPSKNGRTPGVKRKFTADDSNDVEKMKVFAQVQTSAEYERLRQVFSEEKELKNKIEQLSELRKQGFTVLRDWISPGYYQKRSSSPKPDSMAKESEGEVERLGLLIDEGDTKDDERTEEGSKEMACMPGYDGLNKSEKKLCNSLKLLPATYLKVKASVVEDYVKRLGGIPAKIRFPSGVDRTHRRQILSFLSDNGWIGII